MNNNPPVREKSEAKFWFDALQTPALPIIALILCFLTLFLVSAKNPHFLASPESILLNCKSKIRNTGMAMMEQIFEDESHLYYPTYIKNEQGQKLHSWRVSLLPYQEYKALFHQIDLSEPWDSKSNRELLDDVKMIQWICPSDEDNMSNVGASFFTITGPETLFPDEGSVTLEDVSNNDGMTQTILISESTLRVEHWAQPLDIPFSDVKATPAEMHGYGPSSVHHGVINIYFADGRTTGISDKIDPDVLRALITWNGQEEVPEDF